MEDPFTSLIHFFFMNFFLFGYGSWRDASEVKDILYPYYLATGIKLNMQKYSICVNEIDEN